MDFFVLTVSSQPIGLPAHELIGLPAHDRVFQLFRVGKLRRIFFISLIIYANTMVAAADSEDRAGAGVVIREVQLAVHLRGGNSPSFLAAILQVGLQMLQKL